MKVKYLIFLLLTSLTLTQLSGQTISFTDTLFKEVLVNHLCVDNDRDGTPEATADTNGDLEIDVREAAAVQGLILNRNVLTLQEINYFKNLKELSVTSRISQPDFSQNTLLEELELNLTDVSVQFKSLPNLIDFRLKVQRDIKSIIISENPKLDFLELKSSALFGKFADLDTIDISNNKLREAHINLDWWDSQSKYFDASSNAIEILFLHERVGFFEVFDVRNNKLTNTSFIEQDIPQAQILRLDDNEFESLEIRQFNVPHYELSYFNNPLKEFILFNELAESELGDFDFNSFKELQKINLRFIGKLNAIRIDELSKLKEVSISTERVANGLYMSRCPNMEKAIFHMKTNLHFDQMAYYFNAFGDDVFTAGNIYIVDDLIDQLTISNNYVFDTLFIKNCPDVQTLFIDQFSNEANIQIENLPVLKALEIKEFEETMDLKIYDCPELTEVYIGFGDRLNFNFRNIGKLERFTNKVADFQLDISQLQFLKYFETRTRENAILNLSNLPVLDSLVLNGRSFANLQLSNLPELTFLTISNYFNEGQSCYNNPEWLQGELSIQNLPSLKTLIVDEVCLKNAILNQLPSLTELTIKEMDIDRDNGFFTISNLASLASLKIERSRTRVFTLKDMAQLKELELATYSIDDLCDIRNCASLQFINTRSSPVSTLNLLALPNLKEVEWLSGRLDTINLFDLPALERFTHNLNQVINAPFDIQIGELNSLRYFELDVSRVIDTLDFSLCPKIDSLDIYFNDSLQLINLKNGNDQFSYIRGRLNYVNQICVDNEEEKAILESFNSRYEVVTDCSSNNITSRFNGRVILEDLNGMRYPIDGFNFPIIIKEQEELRTLFTDHTGYFEWSTDLLEDTITIAPIFDTALFEIMGGDTQFVVEEPSFITIEYILKAKEAFPDLQTFMYPLEAARPGEEVSYRVIVKNKGMLSSTGNILLTFDESVAEFLPQQNIESIGNEIRYQIPEILPYSFFSLDINFVLNRPTDDPPLNQDDILDFSLSVDSALPDPILGNNQFKIEDIVVNSYDPNNIVCLQGNTFESNTEIQPVYYKINFENNGNAPANRVRLTNPIDQRFLDVGRIEILDQSHSVQTYLQQDTLTFIFEDIQLGYLEGENQGYVLYAIYPTKDLGSRDTVINQAAIYFDFNPPILTNIHTLNFAETTSVENIRSTSFSIYPNPSTGVLFIQDEGVEWNALEIYDTRLRKVFTAPKNTNGYDVSFLNAGIYFVKVYSEELNVLALKKYIILD